MGQWGDSLTTDLVSYPNQRCSRMHRFGRDSPTPPSQRRDEGGHCHVTLSAPRRRRLGTSRRTGPAARTAVRERSPWPSVTVTAVVCGHAGHDAQQSARTPANRKRIHLNCSESVVHVIPLIRRAHGAQLRLNHRWEPADRRVCRMRVGAEPRALRPEAWMNQKCLAGRAGRRVGGAGANVASAFSPGRRRRRANARRRFCFSLQDATGSGFTQDAASCQQGLGPRARRHAGQRSRAGRAMIHTAPPWYGCHCRLPGAPKDRRRGSEDARMRLRLIARRCTVHSAQCRAVPPPLASTADGHNSEGHAVASLRDAWG